MNRQSYRSPFLLFLLALASWSCTAAAQATIKSMWALSTDPGSQFWRAAPPVYMDSDPHGYLVPEYRTGVRTRWTKQNLYFLFVCPYEQLNLKPNPKKCNRDLRIVEWGCGRSLRRRPQFESGLPWV
jgi:hypothetical protein